MELFMFILGYVSSVLTLTRGAPQLGYGVIALLSLGTGAAFGFGYLVIRDRLGH